MCWRGSDRYFEAVLVDESPPSSVVNGTEVDVEGGNCRGSCNGRRFIFWTDLVDVRMKKGVAEIG